MPVTGGSSIWARSVLQTQAGTPQPLPKEQTTRRGLAVIPETLPVTPKPPSESLFTLSPNSIACCRRRPACLTPGRA